MTFEVVGPEVDHHLEELAGCSTRRARRGPGVTVVAHVPGAAPGSSGRAPLQVRPWPAAATGRSPAGPSTSASGTAVSGLSWASSHAPTPTPAISATWAGVAPQVARRARCSACGVDVGAAARRRVDVVASGATAGDRDPRRVGAVDQRRAGGRGADRDQVRAARSATPRCRGRPCPGRRSRGRPVRRGRPGATPRGTGRRARASRARRRSRRGRRRPSGGGAQGGTNPIVDAPEGVLRPPFRQAASAQRPTSGPS